MRVGVTESCVTNPGLMSTSDRAIMGCKERCINCISSYIYSRNPAAVGFQATEGGHSLEGLDLRTEKSGFFGILGDLDLDCIPFGGLGDCGP